jgi:hypothetical protein
MQNFSDGILVLYDLKIEFHSALELGINFFQRMGVKPNDAGCYLKGSLDGSPMEVKSFRSTAALEPWMTNPDLQYITIASRKKGNPSAQISFYYGHDELHPDFNRLIIAHKASETAKVDISDWMILVKESTSFGSVPYGFACHLNLDDVTQYEYSDAQALFVPFLSYEAPDLWKVEVPTHISGHTSQRRYLSGMLRLVYEWNLVTSLHLEREIAGTNLRAWINENSSRGILHHIDRDLWAWSVETAYLTEINDACGQAGMLVAWKSSGQPKPTIRRLP